MPRGFFLLLMLAAPVLAAADEPATPVDATQAFETAYAASFYEFDACGDGLSGRSYRRALSEKVAQCSFPADVKTRFVLRAAAQRQKSAKVMAKLIEDNGGLPVRLGGMTRTCREQSETPESRRSARGWTGTRRASSGWTGSCRQRAMRRRSARDGAGEGSFSPRHGRACPGHLSRHVRRWVARTSHGRAGP